jgi:hypothetical protein
MGTMAFIWILIKCDKVKKKIEASLQIDTITLISHTGRRVISCEIHAKRNGNAASLSPNFFEFPLLIMLPSFLYTSPSLPPLT